MPGSESDNPIERLLASLATPATAATDAAASDEKREGATTASATTGSEDRRVASGAGSGGEAELVSAIGRGSAAQLVYGDDEATPEDLAERRRRAEWSLEGGLGRTASLSLLFTFSLFQALREQWDHYPEDDDALEQLIRDGNATVAVAASTREV